MSFHRGTDPRLVGSIERIGENLRLCIKRSEQAGAQAGLSATGELAFAIPASKITVQRYQLTGGIFASGPSTKLRSHGPSTVMKRRFPSGPTQPS